MSSIKFEDKYYWAYIPCDAANKARAEYDYIGPCKISHNVQDKDKLLINIPVDHFYLWDTCVHYILVKKDYIKLSEV